MLARREHSQHELRLKLQKSFSTDDIEPVLEILTREGLVSDIRFVESFIRYKREQGHGPLRISAELSERGIQKELIEHHLQISDNAWLTNAQKVWQKRFKNCPPKDYKTRAQQMRFLHYRGFTREQIEKVINSSEDYD